MNNKENANESEQSFKSILIQMDNFLAQVEVKGSSVEPLFKARVLVYELDKLIKNYTEGWE